MVEYILFFSFIDSIKKEKDSIEKMFCFIGEVDSAISTASLKVGETKICTPNFTKEKQLISKEIYHPLIDNCIPNNINLIDRSMLLTGSNMSGKTTFINALLKAMGSIDVATSPTFSIVNEYVLPNDKIYHFDFYRIESLDEAYNFGIEDYFNSNNWLFIEWAERVEELLPEDTQTITITDLNENKRSLKLTIETDNLTKTSAMTEPKF